MAKKPDYRLAQFNPEDLLTDEEEMVPTMPPVEVAGVDPNTGVGGAPTGLVPPALEQAARSPLQDFIDMMNSPEQRALRQKLQERSVAAVDEQRAGLQENERAFNEYAQPGIGQAAGLVDSLTGSKFSDRYQNSEQKQAGLLALRKALQDQRKSLSDQEIELLKSQLGGTDAQKMLAYAATDARSKRGYDEKVSKSILDRYEKATKEMEQKATEFDNLYTNLNSGNINRISSSLSNFARLIGNEKGALSEGDTNRAMAKNLEVQAAKWEQYFTGGGKVNNDVIKDMLKMTAQAKSFLRYAYQKKIEKVRDTLKGSTAYKDYPDVEDQYQININQLEGTFGAPPEKVPAKAQVPKAPGGKKKETPEEELKRLKAEVGVE